MAADRACPVSTGGVVFSCTLHPAPCPSEKCPAPCPSEKASWTSGKGDFTSPVVWEFGSLGVWTIVRLLESLGVWECGSLGVWTIVLEQCCEVGVAEDIDIMDEDGAVGVEERSCFFDAATRFEQLFAFVADADVEPEVVVRLQIVDDLVGEMMHIDHNALYANRLESVDDMPQERLPPYPDQCLRHRVGKRFEACAETCGENHSLFHEPIEC